MKRALILLFALLSLTWGEGRAETGWRTDLLNAYLEDNMPVWKVYIDSCHSSADAEQSLPYEYGYCAALMEKNKTAAKPYVLRFKQNVEAAKDRLPAGHYEMYKSAVYVYELRLHESFHPVRSLDLARKAVKIAPDDPLTLTYCGMALFYAPKPFGNKKEALNLFLRAYELFAGPQWHNCWWKAAAVMYIAQCYQKQGNLQRAQEYAEKALAEYPNFRFIPSLFSYLLHTLFEGVPVSEGTVFHFDTVVTDGVRAVA